MFRSSVSRWIVGVLVLIALLGVVRFKPWRLFTQPKTETINAQADLRVGFLPVT